MGKKEFGKRAYKDTVFVDLFAKDIYARDNFISLYNALHDEPLDAATAKITPITLENVLYHGYFNDVSMLVNDKIIFFAEHQSTINENMPLRFLVYLSRMYEQMLDFRKRFARKLQKLPRPEFYVFYNGADKFPKEKTLRLSDAFLDKNTGTLALEIIVKVVNINKDGCSEVLHKSKPLAEYSEFVEYVRRQPESSDKFSRAIQAAIDADVLREYLSRKRKEVENMVIGMYDYDLDMEVQREEAREAGREEGREEGAYDARLETARGMLLYGMPKDKVAEISGLPLAEVCALAQM